MSTSNTLTEDITQAIADPGALVNQFKAGYKTSEFWVSGIALLVPVVAYAAQLFGYHVSTAELSASLAGFVPTVGYVVGRSWLKKSRVTAVASVVASTPAVAVEAPVVVPALPPEVVPALTPEAAPVVDVTAVPAAPDVSPLSTQIQAEITAQVTAAMAAMPAPPTA